MAMLEPRAIRTAQREPLFKRSFKQPAFGLFRWLKKARALQDLHAAHPQRNGPAAANVAHHHEAPTKRCFPGKMPTDLSPAELGRPPRREVQFFLSSEDSVKAGNAFPYICEDGVILSKEELVARGLAQSPLNIRSEHSVKAGDAFPYICENGVVLSKEELVARGLVRCDSPLNIRSEYSVKAGDAFPYICENGIVLSKEELVTRGFVRSDF